MRLKIIRDHELYRSGQVVKLPKPEAELLLKLGIAIITRDMVTDDIKVK